MTGYTTVHGGDPAATLGALLPAGAVAVEAIGEVEPEPLLGDEVRLVARAVESRRLELARGRTCARRALAQLGFPPSPILADDRAPIWPTGVVGSITHCAGYVCAAVARTSTCATLGVDAEVVAALDRNVERQILRADEEHALPRDGHWSCVVFSAKESLYKAWYPLTGRWLDFHDVELRLDPEAGSFEARMLVDVPASWPQVVTGRFAFDRGRVLASVWLSAAGAPAGSPAAT